MFNFNEILESEYKIKSNLYETSLSNSKNEDCANLLSDSFESIAIMNLDKLKDWYCNKHINICSTKGTSFSIKSCDAMYFSPNINNHKHVIIEFKNVNRHTFCKKPFCEEISQKIFMSRSLLLHTFFKDNDISYFKDSVEMLIVYNYDESSSKTNANVKNIVNSFKKNNNKTKTKTNDSIQEQEPLRLAESNISHIQSIYAPYFYNIQIIKVDDFKSQYKYNFQNYKCKYC